MGGAALLDGSLVCNRGVDECVAPLVMHERDSPLVCALARGNVIRFELGERRREVGRVHGSEA